MDRAGFPKGEGLPRTDRSGAGLADTARDYVTCARPDILVAIKHRCRVDWQIRQDRRAKVYKVATNPNILAPQVVPQPIQRLFEFRVANFLFPSWSTGFRCSDFCWRRVEPHGCSGGGITVVPEPNGHVLTVGPRASRVAVRTHNRKIRSSPWRYLNLLDLHSLETLAEWTGKAAVLVSLRGAGRSCQASVNSWIWTFAQLAETLFGLRLPTPILDSFGGVLKMWFSDQSPTSFLSRVSDVRI